MPPVGAAIGAIVGGIGSAVGAAFAGMTLSSFAGRLLLSVAVSALSSAMVKKPKLPGIRTDQTLTGGTQAESWIIGKSATAGVAVCPAMTYGVPRTLEGSGTDNEFRVLVIDVSGIAGGPGLLRLFINDEVVELGEEEDILPGWSDGSPLPEEPLGGWFPGITWPPGTGETEPAEVEPAVSRGVKALGKYAGYLSVIWRDGTENEADPYLLRVFGQYPDRPWTVDMIGRGRQICILTFKLNRELFPSSPKVGFELAGIPLYDPRLDDSVGGSGPQRWSDPATWTVSHNTAVQAYNILRGLRVGPEVWGGNASAAALPLPVFTAAMDRADAAVALAGGGSEPRYRTGLEVLAADEPASILEDLLTAANGDLAEVGGEWRIRLGEPEGPVLFVTDADIIVSKPQDYDPFPGLEQTHNAVTGTWPDPDSLWEAREAPPIHNPAWEEADGDLVWDEILPGWIRRPRRLTAALTLNACPYGQQVQRVMRAYINDERRFAAHHITLGPEASHVEPLDVISWTSARNGYAAKLFEVQEVVHDLMGGQVSLSIREVDPADYDWSPALEQPMPAPPAAPAEAPLLRPMTESGSYAGPFFAGAALADAEGADRRPVIIASWSPALAALATGMEWQIRLAGEAEVILHGSIQTVAAGRAEISAGILPGASYEARLTPVAPALRVQPSAWEPVTVPDVRLTADDLADPVQVLLEEAGAVRADLLVPIEESRRRLQFLEPRAVSLSEQIDTIAAHLAQVSLSLNETQGRIADAGLYLDPETGRARLEGFSRIDGILTQIGIDLDAVRGSLTLYATLSDISEAVSEALLDPTQIPIIDDLTGQVAALQIALDAATAAITLKADLVALEAATVRLTTAEADIDALQAEILLRVAQTTFDALEARTTEAEAALSAFDGAAWRLSLVDIRQLRAADEDQAAALLGKLLADYEAGLQGQADLAYLRQDMRALVDEDRTALATLRSDLGVAIDQTQALIGQEATARAAADTALALIANDLSARLGTAEGDIDAQADASSVLAGRVDAAEDNITAISTAQTELSARLGAAEGDIDAQADASSVLAGRVDAAEDNITAISSAQTELSAAVGDVTAEVETQGTALATLEGHASASYVMRARVGGAAGEVEVVAASDPEGAAASAVVIRSDRFRFEGDLAEFLGAVKVETLHIGENAVIIPVYASSGAVIPNESTSAAVDIISTVINRDGYRTRVSFGGQLDGIPPALQFGRGAVGLFEVHRGGSVIAGNMAHATGYMGARTSFCFVFDDPDLGTGPTTYTVRMRRVNSGEADRVPRVIAPWLELLQFKR